MPLVFQNKLQFLLLIVVLATLMSCSDAEKGYYPDGTLKFEYPVSKGKYHGVAFQYYPNGKIKHESNWVMGVKKGFSKKYYKNGQLEIVAQYDNDVQSGWAYKYDSSGLLESKTLYKENRPDSFEILYTTGARKAIGVFSGNLQNSITYHYYESGKPDQYEVKKADTLFYQKWYREDGSFGGTYLPLSISLDSLFCVELLHTQLPEDSIKVRLYLQNIDKDYIIDSEPNDQIEGNGMKICTEKYSIADGLVEGYLCEFFTKGNVNYGCMPFKFDTSSGRMIKVVQTKP